MGLLDDAIREHLELKRRHGAAEEEVRRQEQEALGPPRRGEVPEPLVAPSGAPLTPEAQDDVDDVEPLAHDADVDAPAAYAAAPAPAPAPADPDPDAQSPASVYEDEPWLADAAPAPAPAQPADAQPAPATPDEDDVLEETPDFLQETPEHDRLWFEQKPPKDFDFDK